MKEEREGEVSQIFCSIMNHLGNEFIPLNIVRVVVVVLRVVERVSKLDVGACDLDVISLLVMVVVIISGRHEVVDSKIISVSRFIFLQINNKLDHFSTIDAFFFPTKLESLKWLDDLAGCK